MYESLSQALGHHWRGMVVRGVLSVIFGVLAMAWPHITVDVLVVLFGVSAIADGVVSLVAALRPTAPDRGRLAAGGVAAIALGIIAFVWPSITALGLVALIGAWFIATGLEHVAAAIGMARGTPGRGLLGVGGVAGGLFGGYLLLFPGSGAVALVVTIGVFAVLRGVGLVVAAVASRREHNDTVAVSQLAA